MAFTTPPSSSSTAKHGQSPIDAKRYVAQLKTGTSPATLLSEAGYLPDSESTLNPTGIGPTEDDISQIWLKHTGDTASALNLLEDNLNQAGISEIFSGNALRPQLQQARSRRRSRSTHAGLHHPAQCRCHLHRQLEKTLRTWRLLARRHQCHPARLQPETRPPHRLPGCSDDADRSLFSSRSASIHFSSMAYASKAPRPFPSLEVKE